MVAAESTFELPLEEIHLRSVRKYADELDLRWWERLFLYLAFLPAVRIGFKYMHIPAPSAMKPDGTVEFVEQVEAFIDEDTANAACVNSTQGALIPRFAPERYSVKPLPLHVELPDGSVQYKLPRGKYQRRAFPEPVSTSQVAQIKRNLQSVLRSTATTQ